MAIMISTKSPFIKKNFIQLRSVFLLSIQWQKREDRLGQKNSLVFSLVPSLSTLHVFYLCVPPVCTIPIVQS